MVKVSASPVGADRSRSVPLGSWAAEAEVQRRNPVFRRGVSIVVVVPASLGCGWPDLEVAGICFGRVLDLLVVVSVERVCLGGAAAEGCGVMLFCPSSLGDLRWVAVVRRRRDAVRRWGAPWWRSGAGGWRRLRSGRAAALGPRGCRWLGPRGCRWLGRASTVGPCWLYLFFGCFVSSCCFVSCWLFMVIALLKISPYSSGVGLVGLGACFCTLCALSALGRWRVPCICKWSQPPRDSKMSTLGWRRVPCVVKWSLPPSGRVKLSVTGCFVQWQHDGKAAHMDTMLSCNRVADLVIFPSCHRCVTYVKANRVAIRALFASWCFVEYSYSVETHDSMSGCSLDAHCNQGFWFFVPPLYSTVSLMKA